MKLVGLSTYGICVRDENNRNKELHDICGVSLVDYLEDVALKSLDMYEDDRAEESVFAFSIVNKCIMKNEKGQDIYEVLYAQIKTGDYGEESEIVDRKTGSKTHTKSTEEADVMPFGFCVMVPCGKYNEGVVMLQSLGRSGITGLMKKKFNEYIRAIDGKLRFVMDPIVPASYMEKFFKDGVLKSIRMIRYGIPDDLSEKYHVDKGVRKITEERIIRKPSGFLRNQLDILKRVMEGKISYEQIVQLDDFEIDDFKLEFSMGKRNKTISMKNLDKIVANEEITDDVILDNGHPTFESLCKVMKETGEFYLIAKGLLIQEE